MSDPGISPDEIKHRFGYHKATFPVQLFFRDESVGKTMAEFAGELTPEGEVATGPMHALVRQTFIAFATTLNAIVPAGREHALMMTKLQEAAMWANAGIAMQSPLEEE